MSDTFCARCGEPWDTDHIRHDELWGAVSANLLTIDEVESWNGTLTDKKVSTAFSELGWTFAGSIYAVTSCPDCKRKPPLPNYQERIGMVTVLAETLGDDEDALICMIEDALPNF